MGWHVLFLSDTFYIVQYALFIANSTEKNGNRLV